MARYIDAESDCVKEVIYRRAFTCREDIQNFIDNIPTANVVPVRSVNKMFALGLFLGFIIGMVTLAVAACIFVENEENNNRK